MGTLLRYSCFVGLAVALATATSAPAEACTSTVQRAYDDAALYLRLASQAHSLSELHDNAGRAARALSDLGYATPGNCDCGNAGSEFRFAGARAGLARDEDRGSDAVMALNGAIRAFNDATKMMRVSSC